MVETEEINNAPQSILDQILSETLQKLEEEENFDSELILKIKKVKLPGNISSEKELISILRGEPP